MVVGRRPMKTPKWWGEIPLTSKLSDDVEWVRQNRVLVVEERADGPALLWLGRSATAAPSFAALDLLELSTTNRKGFHDLAARVAMGSVEGAGEADPKDHPPGAPRLAQGFARPKDDSGSLESNYLSQTRARKPVSNWAGAPERCRIPFSGLGTQASVV